MAEEVWVTAGAPLEGRQGWRIWYSRVGAGEFEPGEVTVSRHGTPVAHTSSWHQLDAVPGYARRMGVLTVGLPKGSPAGTYDVTVPERGERPPLRWQPLPSEIGDERVSFLLGSCFWRHDDKEGAYADGVRDLRKLISPTPTFRVLMGDQLYLDWPLGWLTGKPPLEMFASRYEDYWGDETYRELLAALPTYMVGDDHEFWNNYPERQPQLPFTWTAGVRSRAAEATQALYHVFQRAGNPDRSRFYSFRIDPVSFFVADPRSERTPFKVPQPRFFSDDQWTALEAWAAALTGPGVLVIGQPVFQKPGDWKDRSLANFEAEYGHLCELLEGIQSADHDVLILTGDIHTGRYSAATVAQRDPGRPIHEFVASPASLVSPYLPTHKPSEPPSRFRAHGPGGDRIWEVVVRRTAESPSVDNNVGAVAMSRGNNGRIRFELELWRVRAFDKWSYLSRGLGRRKPARLTRIFHHEIELR
jgi:hypothetical protein